MGLVRSSASLAAGALLCASAASQTQRASVASGGTEASGLSKYSAISSDGRYVAFQSHASNLVPGDTNGVHDVFVRDLLSGTTVRASVDSSGVEGTAASHTSAISRDGRYVLFYSNAWNLVPGDTNGVQDVFVRDLTGGTTARVSVDSNGLQAEGWSYSFAITDDGRYVLFGSIAANLVSGDANGHADVFVRDLTSGTTTLVSVGSTGIQGDGDSGSGAISSDGRYVAFVSTATNLVASDNNGSVADIFVRDLVSGTTTLESVDSTAVQGFDGSYFPSLSANGPRPRVLQRG
jgi:Tol biopolymer transport system component